MYTAPDFIRVDMNVKESYSGSPQCCVPDEETSHQTTSETDWCEDLTNSFIDIMANNCYSGEAPSSEY